MKVLIAVDGSAYARRVIEFAVGHKEMLGPAPDVTLITVVPTIPAYAARHVDRKVLDQYHDEESAKALVPARDALASAGIVAQSVTCKGHAPTMIAAHASSGGYDLLLMGSHGHSAVANLVLGSVVTGVLAQCRTPVLVVR
jgi:nucleotide-binding universal stress UspA family protein